LLFPYLESHHALCTFVLSCMHVLLLLQLPWIAMRPERVEQFMNLSLKKLQTTYVDLYLVHWPMGMSYLGEDIVSPMKDGELYLDLESDLEGVWKQMEVQCKAGKAKSIGISNCTSEQIERIMKIAKIPPANLQVNFIVELVGYFRKRLTLSMGLKYFCRSKFMHIFSRNRFVSYAKSMKLQLLHMDPLAPQDELQ
jgi:hypothetical protein